MTLDTFETALLGELKTIVNTRIARSRRNHARTIVSRSILGVAAAAVVGTLLAVDEASHPTAPNASSQPTTAAAIQVDFKTDLNGDTVVTVRHATNLRDLVTVLSEHHLAAGMSMTVLPTNASRAQYRVILGHLRCPDGSYSSAIVTHKGGDYVVVIPPAVDRPTVSSKVCR